MTNKDKALKAFRSQLEAVDNINSCSQGQIWRTVTADIIGKYLGENSNLLIHVNSSYSMFVDNWHYNHDKHRARDIIEKCIEYVELMGIEEPPPIAKLPLIKTPKSNFISRMPNDWAIFWAGCLITVFGSGGYYFGTYVTSNRIDREKISLESKIESLEKQLSIIRMRLTNGPAKKEGSRTKNLNNK